MFVLQGQAWVSRRWWVYGVLCGGFIVFCFISSQVSGCRGSTWWFGSGTFLFLPRKDNSRPDRGSIPLAQGRDWSHLSSTMERMRTVYNILLNAGFLDCGPHKSERSQVWKCSIERSGKIWDDWEAQGVCRDKWRTIQPLTGKNSDSCNHVQPAWGGGRMSHACAQNGPFTCALENYCEDLTF